MEILVISSYPEKSMIHGNKTVGVGNYTKLTLLALTKCNPDLSIKVFAEVMDKPEEYVENRILVKRIWQRGKILSIAKMFWHASNDNAKTIVLPFEMFMFGGFLQLFFALLFALLLKLRNKKVILVLHQVITSGISIFEGNKLKALAISFVRALFYKYLLFLSNKTVVFEQQFRDKLGSQKVVVIPHAVMQEIILDKRISREKLHLDQEKKYFFYFGYLAEYKGVEELLNIWEKLEGVELIVGGGPNPNHANNPKYKEYINRVMKRANEIGAITTGFIPQEKMPDYFSAADVVIFPYKVFMSSSGPLGHAFSWGNGVLLSNQLRGYFDSKDMRQALEESGISIDEICFSLDKPIKDKIMWALHNIDKLRGFSSRMRDARNWDKMGQLYNDLILEVTK